MTFVCRFPLYSFRREASLTIEGFTGPIHCMAVPAACWSAHLRMAAHAVQMIGSFQAGLILMVELVIGVLLV